MKPGEKIAVVGPTGSGKSTMLSMLPRFFDPVSGVVEIDGVDIREYPIRELRHHVALVLQPPMIFPLSVRDNIAYGRPDASPRRSSGPLGSPASTAMSPASPPVTRP